MSTRKLTEYQKEFILNKFFKSLPVPGWINIARKLLDTGKCIVPGDRCIWIGGIGNYISTKEAENAIDCLLYELDLDLFLSSDWFKEYKIDYEKDLLERRSKIEEEYLDISNL